MRPARSDEAALKVLEPATRVSSSRCRYRDPGRSPLPPSWWNRSTLEDAGTGRANSQGACRDAFRGENADYASLRRQLESAALIEAENVPASPAVSPVPSDSRQCCGKNSTPRTRPTRTAHRSDTTPREYLYDLDNKNPHKRAQLLGASFRTFSTPSMRLRCRRSDAVDFADCVPIPYFFGLKREAESSASGQAASAKKARWRGSGPVQPGEQLLDEAGWGAAKVSRGFSGAWRNA